MDRKLLKLPEVPEASLRTHTVMGAAGNVMPWLILVILGSFHAVMAPEKMSPRVEPSNLTLLPVTPETFNGMAMAPKSVGT